MKLGVTTSIAFHVIAVAFGVVSLSAPRPLPVAEVEALPVDIVPIESITKTIEGEKTADRESVPAPKPRTKPEVIENAQNVGDTKQDTKAEAPADTKAVPVEKVEVQAAKPDPRPEPKPTPVPTPELKVEPKPKTEVAILEKKPEMVEPIPEETVEDSFKAPERITRPKKRPERPKPETAQTNKRKDITKLIEETKKKSNKKKDGKKDKVLLNKETSSAGGAKRSDSKAALGSKNSNNNTRLSQAYIDAVRTRLIGCFNAGDLPGNKDANTMRGVASFKLGRDGSIDGRVKTKVSGTTGQTRAVFAVRMRSAISECAPFDLPADSYEDWADMEVNFSLKDML